MMKQKILIIDDEPMNLEFIVKIFEDIHEGYEIYQSNDGLQAYEVIKKALPDIVITDWNMPNSGLDLVKKMRANPEFADIPVLVYSGTMTSTENLFTALEAGATDYINKPINPMELIARSHSMIKLSQSLKRIKTLNESRNLLFNIIAHDLKNSVGSMQNILDLLTTPEYVIDESKKSSMLSNAAAQAQKSYNLLENLLNWARSQLGSLKAHHENIELSELVRDVISEYEEQIKTNDISILNHCKNDVFIFADRHMMEMIVRNIIGNSIKYTHNGGRIKVLCSIPPDNKTVVLTISDNGSGMSNFHLKDILNQDKFINQYGVRGEKGNGLGIKLVQELIKLNNGSFKILSEINEGTTVYISVPIRNT